MDALKDRVGGFTECSLTMACSVLLAVALKKVDLSSEGNASVRRSIAPLAAVSLILCPVVFISLRLGSWAKIIFGLKQDHPIKLWILRLMKPLLHVSSIFQMVLAYMIYLLITMNSPGAPPPMWIWLAICCLVVIVSLIWSVLRTIDPESFTWPVVSKIKYQQSVEDWEAANTEQWWNKNLQLLLDLSTAVTALLFVGLEGLALEGQTSGGIGEHLTPRLGTPVRVAFAFCVLASAITLLATVPPFNPTREEDSASNVCNPTREEDSARNVCLRNAIHVCSALLAISLISVVTVIIVSLVPNNKKEALAVKIRVTVVPPLVLLFSYLIFCKLLNLQAGENNGELKPASLEMTKVTFAACLAISLPSFRGGDGHLSDSTKFFIVTAAMSVTFGLGWRFFSHFEKNDCIWISKAACVFTYLCLVAAAIELLCMAES